MKTLWLLIFIVISLTPISVMAQAPSPVKPNPNPVRLFAYYLSGNQNGPFLTPQKIDYQAFSDLIHFGINANPDGTVDSTTWGMTPYLSNQMVSYCHAHGDKVLICLGSDDNDIHIRHALTAPFRAKLAYSLAQFVVQRGYDGIDLDYEPLDDPDVPDFEQFVPLLRAALDVAKPGLLLTAAVATQPAMFARLQNDFDQINMMTYELSGPWPGFKTWYNAGLYGGGAQKMADGSDYPSVDQMVAQFEQAGISPAKLGIGIGFGGDIWYGATGPMQSIKGVSVDDDADYKDIMKKYFRPDRYHWDSQAQAPYLSIDSPTFAYRRFISYDDETLCAKKIAYIRQKGLAGAIIWELSGGYRDDQPAGKRDLLLQSIKRAWRGRNRK